jgi:simple sugar transport system permease protein
VSNRRFLPVMVTVVLFFAIYGLGAYYYEAMRDPQVFFNLFRTSPFLLISAVGMTLVIISGGIDLSVGGVIALTTVASAALLRLGFDPWVVMLLMLAMGMAIGAIMGGFITFMKVQPFIATLAGLWVARGLCFFISDDAISIDNRVYRILGQTKILIPGLADPVTKTGDYISILVVVSLIVFGVGMYIAHYRRFGRNIYAIGGNEHSARLMGLPADTTKLLVYTFNGFCSALAGITLSIYVLSGHGLYAQGFELTVIAAVVIGGTMLTGGVGYVFGTLFGVLVTGLIQTLIQFNGQLSSWWTNIVVGVLMLVFIGIQSLLAARNSRWLAGKKMASEAHRAGAAPAERPTGVLGGLRQLDRRTRQLLLFGGAIALLLVSFLVFNSAQNLPFGLSADTPLPVAAGCELKPFRRDQATELMTAGAVLAYERNGGPDCIDELYSVYADGRIVGDDGTTQIEKQVSPAEVEQLLADISARGWFTGAIYDTWHKPCGQCFEYFINVSYQGQTKVVKAVDGGTDAPADYWQVVSRINGVIPKFETAP